jgi:hypothetical protein
MAADHDISGRRILEAAHRPQSLLKVAVIALQSVIQVSGAPMPDAWQDRPQRRRVTSRLVGDDTLWRTAYPKQFR